MNILIATKHDDTHAIYTKLALSDLGHHCALWYTNDFPLNQTHTFKLEKNISHWTVQGRNLAINEDEFGVVWYRRPTPPEQLNHLHPDDIKNAHQENMTMYQSLWHVIAPDALWINPFINARRIHSKIYQLKIASKIGMQIPRTIISNNPHEIKTFIEHEHSVIYKTLYPLAWLHKDNVRLTYTTKITSDNLPSDQALQSTPGIYQVNIKKAYEVRVTYFGNYAVAIKLYSQQHVKGRQDWRYIPTEELRIERFYLPPHIHQLCLAFMQRVGIVFGCFDFIVSEGGEYYFLEVNESGQFLWIEEVNQEIKMLDIFIKFLLNSSYQFQYRQSTETLNLSDYQKQAKEVLKNELDYYQQFNAELAN